jgi:hypothetical protein
MLTLPVFLWLAAHLTMVILVIRPISRLLTIPILLAIFAVYFLKPYTYDLTWYLEYFANPASQYEVGFWVPTLIYQRLNLPAETILLVWQLTIFLVVYFAMSVAGMPRADLKIVVILSALFFMLTSQNGLRQGVSCAFVLLAFSLSLKGKCNTGAIAAILAMLTHDSGLFFVSMMVLWWLWSGRIFAAHMLKMKSIVDMPGYGLLIGCMVLLLLKFYFSDSDYLDQSTNWGDERSPSWLKILAISVVYFVSQSLFMKTNTTGNIQTFKSVRTFYFFFLIPLSMLPEAFARLAYFYYALEMMLVAALLTQGTKFIHRLAACFILVAYGFAPNALNVIGNVG